MRCRGIDIVQDAAQIYSHRSGLHQQRDIDEGAIEND